MIPYMVGKLAPNSSHLTRGLVKYVLGRGYFRAVFSKNGDKFVTSPPPPQSLNGSLTTDTAFFTGNRLGCACRGKTRVMRKYFSYYHIIHHGLIQEKFRSEEGRRAPLTPLPKILSITNLVLFCSPKNCFVTFYTNVMVPGTPPRCSISYRFWGSPSIITPHQFPISNYASEPPFWKSTASYRFPNRS